LPIFACKRWGPAGSGLSLSGFYRVREENIRGRLALPPIFLLTAGWFL